jgi:signal transduction histidine kinase
LEEKNRELEQFAFIAAHDLKSPLNGISSISDLLISTHSEVLQSDGLRMLQAIKGSSLQLSALIGGLLDYYRLDSAFNEQKSPISRNELMDQVKNLFGNEEGIQMEFSIVPAEINSHGPVLLQVLLNLISNAIKYSDKSHTTIHVEIVESEGAYLVSVADNGAGIDSQFHDKLFQLFETAASSDRYGKRGNGIGLATVKKLVTRAGGTIQFFTEKGKGTTFNFTLPR